MNIKTTSQGTKKDKVQNDYGVVVIKEQRDGNDIMVILNKKPVGNLMASERGLFRQFRNQEKEITSDFDKAIEIAQDWLEQITATVETELAEVVKNLKIKAQEKGYMPSWVFYRMKKFYGYKVAEKMVKTED